MDEHYGVYREGLADLSEPERIAAEAAYVGRVGILPTPLAREIEGGLLAKDAEAQVLAARRFALIDGQLPAPCPEGVFTLVPCERARKLAGFDAMGLEPARAVELTDLVFRPGEDEGEMRTLPFKRGDGSARDLLRPVVTGRNDTLVGDAANDRLVRGEGQNATFSNDVSEWAIPDMPPPTDEPVDIEKWCGLLGFDPGGPGHFGTIASDFPDLNDVNPLNLDHLKDPENFRSFVDAFEVGPMFFEADSKRLEIFSGSSRGSPPEANAFLHALWSFEVTRKWGPDVAKKFGDAHEISIENSDGDRLKDLYNNNAGRLLGVDPANEDRPGADVILEALEAGKLQIEPFEIRE